MVDAGPDTFLARAAEGVELCRKLDLTDELVAPVAAVPAYIHRDSKLLPLPSGTILGIPTDFDAVAASGLVSSEGLARARQDLVLPETTYTDDCSLGWYCRQRLGDEVTMRLVDPLLGGINASNIDNLSLESAFPALATIAKTTKSLVEGLRAHQKSVGATLGSAKPTTAGKPSTAPPVFYSLPGGVARIIDRLVERLEHPANPNFTPVRLHLDSPISDLRQLDTQQIVLACPAPVSSRLLKSINQEASQQLATIDYTSVSQVTFEFNRSATDPVLDASGILFPRVDGLVATAATWLSSKWDHYNTADKVLIRVSSGRADDLRSATMTDDELIAQLLEDLSTVININQPATAVRVQRWVGAFPAYTPGHTDRIQHAKSALQDSHPTIRLAGAAYDGIGIPACIRSGQRSAQELLQAGPG